MTLLTIYYYFMRFAIAQRLLLLLLSTFFFFLRIFKANIFVHSPTVPNGRPNRSGPHISFTTRRDIHIYDRITSMYIFLTYLQYITRIAEPLPSCHGPDRIRRVLERYTPYTNSCWKFRMK